MESSSKLMALAFPALLVSVTGKAEAKQERQNPNIVIIVADDLGWGDLSYHGSMIPTPNIDRIASQGIELDRYYTASLSSPTRCGLMTGRYPDRFRVRTTVIPPWRKTGLDPEEEILPQLLERNGYEDRAAVGKWHLGHAQANLYPLNRGFTHFYGILNGNFDYFTHERDGELDFHNDWQSCYDEGYSTDLIAAEASRCIADYSKKDSPYLVYVAFNAPHSPYQAPEDEIAKHVDLETFKGLTGKKQKGYTYMAMVSRMDTGVGQILSAIEASGEADNTLILFMSDNGGVPNMEPYCTNRPHRGEKGTEWEGGLNNAAAIWWPAGFANGRKIEQVSAFVDIVPTIADIIGAKEKPKRPYDGISLYSVLKGETESISRDLYLGLGAAVNARYKYIKAGVHDKMELTEDFFTDIVKNPSESDEKKLPCKGKAYKKLSKLVKSGEAIIPAIPEAPFGEGSQGFVPPKEWHFDYMDNH